jgi:N-methylhydantoinase B
MSRKKTIDPLTLSVIEASLITINEELGARTTRQAFSMPTARLHDLGTVLFDKKERVLCLGNYMPAHTAGSDVSLKGMLDYIGRDNIHPDDFIISNDPFIVRYGHAPDWSFIRPIFYEGELTFYHYMRTHQYDSGGAFQGCYFVRPYDCHSEGLMIPPFKLVERGVLDEKAHSIILRNVRGSAMVRADNLLIYESMKKCEERIFAMLKRYGKDVMMAACDELIKKTEEAIKKEISTWPAGVYHAERAADRDGSEDKPVWVRLDMTVKPKEGRLIFDFSESDPQVDFINVPLGQTWSYVTTPVAWALSTELHINQGLFNCLELKVKRGTVLDPIYPASSGGQANCLGAEIMECCTLALDQVVPKVNASALWSRHISPIFQGKLRDKIDPKTKSPTNYWSCPFNSDGGSGAVWGYDGTDGLSQAPCGGAVIRAAVECEEAENPYRWLYYEMLTDSAGDGHWRGGLGIHVEYLNTHDPKTWKPLDCVVMTGNSCGEKFGSLGVLGGTEGMKHKMFIKRGEELLPLHTMDTLYIQAGDIIITYSGGGGGVGDPLDRDIEVVKWDAVNDYVSMDKVRDVYGVVMDPKTFEVDRQATMELREKLKAQKAESSR